MESIKHKMDTMVKEKDDAIQKATNFESESAEFEKAAVKFEKEVSEIQRKIAKVEDQLDITISSTKETGEKLEVADKELHFNLIEPLRHKVFCQFVSIFNGICC